MQKRARGIGTLCKSAPGGFGTWNFLLGNKKTCLLSVLVFSNLLHLRRSESIKIGANPFIF